MKKIKLIIALAGLLAFMPISSYALFDIGVYGGYSYKNEIESSNPKVNNPNPTGLSYGFIGHYNQPIFPLLRVGIGLYSQYTTLNYDYKVAGNTNKTEVSYGKKIVGIDLYLQLDIPLLPIHPYVKFASGIWEDLNGDLKQADTKYFNTYTTGIGLALTFFPFLQVFGEYRYDYIKNTGVDTGLTKTNGDPNIKNEKANGQTVFLGLRVFF